MALHELPLDASVLHGHFSRELEPVLTVDPGDSVRFSTPNAGWDVGRDEPFEPREPGARHGPRARRPDRGARRARRSDARRCGSTRSSRGSWGVTFDGAAAPARLGARRTASAARAGRSVRLAPFLGVLGMPPDEPGVHSTIPPRRCGGNIDCKELVAGTTLYLPIPVDGALFSAGDGHAAQGDGEVSGTAIECPVEATADARRARRPASSSGRRADRRRLAHLRLRRAPRRRRADRGRRHARPDGARARARAGGRARASPRSSSTSASPRSSTRCSACTRCCATTRSGERAAAALARARPGRLPPPRRRHG